MPSYSRNEILLVHYPFSDLSATKVRPAAVVHAPHVSQDNLIVPLTSQVAALLAGEFILATGPRRDFTFRQRQKGASIPSTLVWSSSAWGSCLCATGSDSMILYECGWDYEERGRGGVGGRADGGECAAESRCGAEEGLS